MTVMKHNDADWLGKIPDNWRVAQIGDFYTFRNEKVSDTEYQPLSVTMQGIVPQLSTAAKSDAHDNRKLVRHGDFVINSRSDRRGSCGISPYDGSVSVINTVLKPRGKMVPEYYNWLFHTDRFADEFYKWGHGIVDDLWTTKWQEMKRILIVAPSIDEQHAIADYLDEQCARIDKLIEEENNSIDEFNYLKQSEINRVLTKGLNPYKPMKESNYEFLGLIPQDWKVEKFKYVAQVDASLVSPSDFPDLPQLAPDCIKKNTGKIIKERSVKDSGVISCNQFFHKGQIVYSKIRPVLNKVVIAPYDGLCSADMYPLNVSENTEFIQFVMLSTYFVEQVNLITQDRVKMPKINQEELGKIIVVIPPKNEQCEIVKHLTNFENKIDMLISEKQSLINDLKCYKQSLIYECVTGKRKVVA